jgi:2-keto-4-pentenoate hydratase
VSTAAQPLPDADAVDAAATRLLDAVNSRLPCPPVRDVLGSTDVELAYRVQQRLTDARIRSGAARAGRKIGLTSPAVQQQLGVGQPDFGVLFDDMRVHQSEPVPMSRLLQPKIEAEVAFVLEADLDADDLSDAQVRRSVAYALPALEIVDSRIRDWDITITDTVADNASSGLFVLGSRRTALREFEPPAVSMEMKRNGTIASTGNGAACMGDPLIALGWLARVARDLGSPLKAGEVVLSGALGLMVPVVAGDVFEAEISSIGTVAVMFGGKDT